MTDIHSGIRKGTCLMLSALLLAGCQGGGDKTTETEASQQITKPSLQYEVSPDTFSLKLTGDGRSALVSLPGEEKNVADFKEEKNITSWRYPDQNLAVTLETQKDYLQVTLQSEVKEDNEFEWPRVSGNAYYMPFGQGKRVPSEDAAWKNYLRGQEFSAIEQLSMPFFAVDNGDSASVYIMENPYRSELVFSEGSPGENAKEALEGDSGEDSDQAQLNVSVRQEFPEIDPEKQIRFRIYLTDNDPVAAAKIYRSYVTELGNFVTLEQKAEKNENIRKLYGAPHIYLWGENLIAPEDINWAAFRAASGSGALKRLKELAAGTETGTEAMQIFSEIENQDYVADYQKNVLCRYLSEVLRKKDFYDPQAFSVKSDKMNLYLDQEMKDLTESDLLQLNKHTLAANVPEVFYPAETWTDGGTTGLLEALWDAGIDRAFIGLNSWEQAFAKPELVTEAVEKGYLIGPYDSYHSIHKKGEERWITASFPDDTLYEDATVLNKKGEKEAGFQNVGRKLNPTQSLPSVKERMEYIMNSGLWFNAWFIDCDATGEVYDDYTPGRMTTRQQDVKARLERMEYIRDQYGMVIGSEGGNDFAAAQIAFAHGIELKSFSWMDKDMNKNKESEYYIGAYYNPTGGVAAHFAKPIPVKDEYYTLFMNPQYDLPLYKLVYNDSVITTYHWDWSTFKAKDIVPERMVRELLYNVPPLYHLDSTQWETYGESIKSHTNIWSDFSKKAILQEMTEFAYLEKDGSVQQCAYGDKLWVIGNFGDNPFVYEEGEEKVTIPSDSALIYIDGNMTVYTPSAIS